MYFYTYKITLLKGSLTGYYYLGQHRTNDLNDGYAGSGKIIINYYKKYDKIEGETYKKEIIKFYNNLEELNRGERDLIGDKYESDDLCLNLRAGGNQIGFSKEIRDKISKNHKGGRIKGKYYQQCQMTDEIKEKISNSQKGKKQTEEHIRKRMLSKINSGHSKHSELTKQKISETKRKNKKI